MNLPQLVLIMLCDPKYANLWEFRAFCVTCHATRIQTAFWFCLDTRECQFAMFDNGEIGPKVLQTDGCPVIRFLCRVVACNKATFLPKESPQLLGPVALSVSAYVSLMQLKTEMSSPCGMHIPMQFPQIALFQQARRVNNIKTSTFTHGGNLAKSDFSLSVQFEKFTTFILV